MKINYLTLGILVFIISCQNTNHSSTATVDTLNNNTDITDCNTSDGYIWSQLQKKCIRPFEEGISLGILNTASSYQTGAFALLDSIQKKAEIFVSNEDASIVLEKKNDSLFTNGKFHLGKINYCWTLSLNNTQLYQERK